eukprot:98456-Prymnesium_polylepis.1
MRVLILRRRGGGVHRLASHRCGCVEPSHNIRLLVLASARSRESLVDAFALFSCCRGRCQFTAACRAYCHWLFCADWLFCAAGREHWLRLSSRL